jgi:hypothetical protein
MNDEENENENEMVNDDGYDEEVIDCRSDCVNDG